MRSAFKGRFLSFSYNNSWLSCFNGCGIEFRRQENHEELKIFLQNRLISQRFGQKFVTKREEHRLIGNFPRKMWTVHFTMRFEPSDRAKSVGSWPTTRVFLGLISVVRSSSKYPYATTCPRTISRVHDLIATIGSHAIDGREMHTCLMVIRWTEIQQINARKSARSHLTHHVVPCRLGFKN